MRFKLAPGLVLGPRTSKFTATGHFAAGMPIPRTTNDGRVLAGFIAGVVITAAAFMAVTPYLVHR
jgi:hypothetical protein